VPTRSVKVIVLAGSIGAKKRNAYHHRLEAVCTETEFVNLSVVGYAVQGLLKLWQREVSDNRRLARSRAEHEERWALFGGGLNNIGDQGHYSAAHYMRKLFGRMHRDGYSVIATSLTPWGDPNDRRWQGYSALLVHRTTAALALFLRGELKPSEALGRYLRYRKSSLSADSWAEQELPDRMIELYDSALRDRRAKLANFEPGRRALRLSRAWRQNTAAMAPAARALQLQQDAEELAGLPRWYLRPDLQGFDPIHPNSAGHQLMAELMCEQLPESWGCDCAPLAGFKESG
jgi:hypothetical protein